MNVIHIFILICPLKRFRIRERNRFDYFETVWATNRRGAALKFFKIHPVRQCIVERGKKSFRFDKKGRELRYIAG